MKEQKASTDSMKLFWIVNTKVGNEELQEAERSVIHLQVKFIVDLC